MTELNNVSLFGAMVPRLMVLFTVFGAMANQMTGLVKKTVLNFTTMAGMIWRALGITTTCAKDPKASFRVPMGGFQMRFHATKRVKVKSHGLMQNRIVTNLGDI